MKLISNVLLCLIILQSSVFAQSTNDSLFIQFKGNIAIVNHKIQPSETIYSIAEKYNAPPALIASNNGLALYDRLIPNTNLNIPIGAHNYVFIKSKSLSFRSLYYKCLNNDRYVDIANKLGISDKLLLDWNKGLNNLTIADKTILCGWILFQTVNNNITTLPKNKDGITHTQTTTIKLNNEVVKKATAAPKTEFEKIFNYQTQDGLYIDSTEGMVAFYKPQIKIKSDMLFAFSDEFAKGKVIKIANPSNGNFVYVKVIGPLPKTKQYINAKIGVDGRARETLNTREVKLWCNFYLKY